LNSCTRTTEEQFLSSTILIIIGPQTGKRGGISEIMPGYFAACDAAKIYYEFIAINHPATLFGKIGLWLWRIPRLIQRIRHYRRAGQNVVVYGHPGNGFSLMRQGVLLLLSRIFGARTIMHLHPIEILGYLPVWWSKILFRISLIGVQQLFVMTPWWKKLLTEAGIDLPMTIIPNPMRQEWFDTSILPAKKAGQNSSSSLHILTMTRLVPGKGVELVIDAMPYLPPEVTLTIAGTGSEEQTLQNRAVQLGVEKRIDFVGWITGSAKKEQFNKADLFCLPSSFDSFGLGFVEVMANGIPIVALNWGPIANVVPDGMAGVLVQESNGQAIAGAVRELMDLEIRERMGSYAQNLVATQYAPHAVGEQIKREINLLYR
jgi:glycosyltransferase involved in cell wall biosynthesis